MATTNIYNLKTGQVGYQTPGATLPAGWAWGSSANNTSGSSSNSTGITNNTYSSPFGTTKTSYYGNSTRNADWEGTALQEETAISDAAKSTNLINSNFITSLLSDSSIVGFYVNAIAYGGYTVGDIVNDMKRRELASQGNSQAQELKIIDPELSRSQFQATAEGQKSVIDTATIVPTFNMQGLTNPDILKYGVNMPDDLFKTLVPIMDNTSQEFKDAVSNIKSAYYDLANQALQASTEQDKAAADYNLEQFKQELEKKYGIALSDDATKAWNQIESLESSFNQRGLTNSGMQNEAIDDYLKTIRLQDQRNRDQKITDNEREMASTYKSSASSAQIQALIDEDKAKGLPQDQWRAVKWGLVPSSDIVSSYDMTNLKARYPDSTDQELQDYRNSVLDENGNYRSTLYTNYYKGIQTNDTSKKSTAETQVLTDAANKEKKAYEAYDTSNVLNVMPSGTGTGNTGATSSPANTSLNSASKTAGDISGSLSSTPKQKKSYNTLYDYYTGTSGSYNSWNSEQRLSDAKKAGITNYTGSADQNNQLLKYLNG